MKESKLLVAPGFIMVVVQLAIFGYVVYSGFRIHEIWDAVTWEDFILPILASIAAFTMFGGYITVGPNDCAVAQFMGKYKGTIKDNGFWFSNPFYGVFHNSLKTENYQTPTLTVNEKAGVPIEIGAIISYKITDTYSHYYNVEDAEAYVKNQFEISLRQHAKIHTYNELSSDDHEFTEDLQAKVEKAGISIVEAKITHLSYAAEIAGSMLQKQQAQSMSEAKQTIVDNAVAIAKHASESINGQMLPEDKSKFIANLIIVLCSDKSVSPVVNVQ